MRATKPKLAWLGHGLRMRVQGIGALAPKIAPKGAEVEFAALNREEP